MTPQINPLAPYDPVSLGARCDLCILAYEGRPDRPVPPETHPGDRLVLIGEAPGAHEVREGRPFVGPSGMRQQDVLKEIGLPRQHCHITNALACRPPDNDLKKLEVTLNARNKNRKKQGKPPRPHPVDCCRPRLLNEIAGHKDIITLGGSGLRALLGRQTSVMDNRGGPITLRRMSPKETPAATAHWVQESVGLRPDPNMQTRTARRVLPTLHPSFVLREPRWTEAFLVDHQRALRFFNNKLTWRDPKMVFNPPIADGAKFLGVHRDSTAVGRGPGWSNGWRATKHRGYGWDLETDSIDAVNANVRCIQIGTDKVVAVIGFLSCEQPKKRIAAGKPPRSNFSLAMRRAAEHELPTPYHFWRPADEAAWLDILRAWLTGPSVKVGWNSNYYDALVTESWLGATPQAHVDGIICHHLVEPELPHSLAYVGSISTDCHRWKASKAATQAQGDEDLLIYGARDTAITYQVVLPLYARTEEMDLGQLRPDGTLSGLLNLDHELQRIGRTMHRIGMLVDQDERQRLQDHYTAIVSRCAEKCREIADDPSLNPNSPDQIAALAFGDPTQGGFGLHPMEWTESGKPSVSDSAVRAVLADPSVPDHARTFLMAYRQFKKADKILGTFLRTAAPLLEGDPRVKAAKEARELEQKARQRVRDLYPLPGAEGLLCGPRLSPADRKLVAAALHDLWELTPVRTAKGAVTVSQAAMLTHWRKKGAPSACREFLTAWFRWLVARSEAKRLEKPPKDDEEGRCLLADDGRVHVNWKAHTVITGRYASSPNCYDWETEILTKRGWIFFRELEEGDEVAQWTPSEGAGEIEFVRPLRVIESFFDGWLTRIKTRSIDLLVTPNHRCPVVLRSGKLEVLEAKDMVPDRMMPHAGIFSGGTVRPLDAWITFLCAVQADGHWHDKAWTFGFTKERKTKRLLDAIEALGDRLELVSVRDRIRHDYTQKRIRVKGVDADNIRDLLGAHKHFGPWLLDWTPDALRFFADEVMRWDGCITRMNHYSSNERVNASWVQAVYTLIGRRARLRPYHNGNPRAAVNWQTDVTQKPYTWTTNAKLAQVPYFGSVHCVEVPSGFVVVRRGQCVVVSGNSQNIPRKVRSMYVPGPGHKYVYADMDQLELRVAASRWGIERYLTAFSTRKVHNGKTYSMDPHQITMHAVFGDDIWDWEGAPPPEWRYYKKWPGGSIDGYFDSQRDLCLAPETEVFVEGVGWLAVCTFVQRGGGARVLQWNPMTHEPEFVWPTGLVDVPVAPDDSWITLRGTRFGVTITADHRCPVARVGGQVEVFPAKAYPLKGYTQIAYRNSQQHPTVAYHIPVERVTSLRTKPALHDRAYCVNVPSSFLVVRGEGDAVTTGNCKRVCYASMYAAEPETVHDVITSAEDRSGRLIYQDLTLRRVELMQMNWKKGVPEVEAGWDREMALVEKLGHFAGPISGRRIFYLNGLEKNKVCNNPIQLQGASLVAIATIKFDRMYPEGFGGPNTGLVNVCHDALVAEVPEEIAPQVAKDMEACMNMTHPTLPGVEFIAEAKVIDAWEPPV